MDNICPTIWVGSIGEVGSCVFSWATSSFKNKSCVSADGSVVLSVLLSVLLLLFVPFVLLLELAREFTAYAAALPPGKLIMVFLLRPSKREYLICPSN